ncbi:hypothetical protein CHRY9390_00588 [Chryseobacterium aquaeductus]|uniref:DUF4347 domain-containing protein n=1 Tax=Chryseobacterium aquaeductus TaxID=2675056 RepID=A0A9N8QRF5_9FLAO|nr:hypothetical protein [Chryseobacterium aquaeductus]CAA7329939.1 hypothetical protein CHRY9390_00588 [Chryseobacterium potabilaquae]CAD7800145.1 hypothetical protein CHRY9390_00588 [Chryseobacterium aquaeductus]
MSKESFIGGDYIETTGGSAKNFAGANIENSSFANQFTQNGKEGGVTYNVNENAPKIEGGTFGLSYIVVVGTQNYSSSTARNLLLRNVGEGSKLMFVHQALRRMRLNKGAIKFDFLLCATGYSSNQRAAIKEAVENDFGGKYVEVNSANEIINYINTADKNNSGSISEERKNKKIQQLLFYSHGVVGEISLGLAPAGIDITAYSFEKEQAEKLNHEAFSSGGSVYLYSCRSGIGNTSIDKSIFINSEGSRVDPNNRYNILSAESIAQKVANSSKVRVYAFLRRTDYERTLFTTDELCFSDYMKARANKQTSVSNTRCGTTYSHLLDQDTPLTAQEQQRWRNWSAVESNMRKIDDTWFDPDGARHNVGAAPSPEGVPDDMKTFSPM